MIFSVEPSPEDERDMGAFKWTVRDDTQDFRFVEVGYTDTRDEAERIGPEKAREHQDDEAV